MREPRRIRGRWWIIPLSMLLALVLMVVEYPSWMRYARPDWITLVIAFAVGVLTAWLGWARRSGRGGSPAAAALPT